MMALDFLELETWFKERPKWLQEAAQRLIRTDVLTEENIGELAKLCFAEATGEVVAFCCIPSSSLKVEDSTESLRLESISEVQGVNALSPKKPLVFGRTPLCIIYGRNGTGKSGYVRLLKNACGARHSSEMLGNIYENKPQPKHANITYSNAAGEKKIKWIGQSLEDLQGVDIYDTTHGLAYVNEENEVAFEPWLLRLFSKLTNTCERLKQFFEAELRQQVSKKPVLPVEYSGTSWAKWYGNLTASIKTEELKKTIGWLKRDEDELNDLNRRLVEANPGAVAETKRRQKVQVLALENNIKNLYEKLTEQACKKFLSVKQEARDKRLAADATANTIFNDGPLDGVGSQTWILLWEAARKYSTENAYPGKSFPNVEPGSRCVLCQRELDTESREKFDSFESFVKGELQTQALASETDFNELMQAMPDSIESSELDFAMDAAGIQEESDRTLIKDVINKLNMRKGSLLTATDEADVSPLPQIDACGRLEEIVTELEEHALALDEDAKGQNRSKLENMVKELKTQKWLSQQRSAIETEIARLQEIEKIQASIALTSTSALSRRKSQLTDELITAPYISRFKSELNNLKAPSLQVDLNKTRTVVGRVYHRIGLTNAKCEAKTSDILSEGEFRIVSIAAFLADAEGRGAKTPFIFDDPASSLDQSYESAMAERFVSLSKHRQVIVFTHRLSLLHLLTKSGEEDVDYTAVCLSEICKGDIAEVPIFLKKTKQAVNRMINDEISELKESYKESDKAYRKDVSFLSKEIRILLEKVVENDLLCGIVRRYIPDIQTKGKINKLAQIPQEDCIFIDKMMSDYSKYEHSAPDETPIELPDPSEIEQDLKALLEMIKKIQTRNGI